MSSATAQVRKWKRRDRLAASHEHVKFFGAWPFYFIIAAGVGWFGWDIAAVFAVAGIYYLSLNIILKLLLWFQRVLAWGERP